MSDQTVRTKEGQSRRGSFRIRLQPGFTLVELLFVLAVLGFFAALAIPRVQEHYDQDKVARAIADIEAIQTEIDSFLARSDSLPSSLADIGRSDLRDPWGTPYQYRNFSRPRAGVPRSARRGRFLVPMNSRYDLYSVGKDGSSTPALTAHPSRDDVVRANDGDFVGLADVY